MAKFIHSIFCPSSLCAVVLALPACGDDPVVAIPSAGSDASATEAGMPDSPDAGSSSGSVTDPSGVEGTDAGDCTPKTCVELGVECGRAADGCGGTLSCGQCGGDSSESIQTAIDACVPRDCEQNECGLVSNGCGGGMECGTCPTNPCDPSLPVQTVVRTARSAHSAGFSGTTDDYFEMYEIACTETLECIELCGVRGGTEEMCAASECTGAEGDTQCLPTTIWTNLDGILFQSDDPAQAVELTAVYGTYHDVLVTDTVELEIPADATILGIGVEIRRMGSDIADYSVKLVKNGEVVGGERAQPALWGDNFEWVGYGGATDLWATNWTVADLLDPSFGVALSVVYAEQAGHARAYVDQVRVTVHYAQGCEG